MKHTSGVDGIAIFAGLYLEIARRKISCKGGELCVWAYCLSTTLFAREECSTLSGHTV